jgi:hypothetical protein
MSRVRSQRIYPLTNRDADRIRALLQSVEAAIAEIIDYRCVRPRDLGEDFPQEASVYRQTNEIMQACEQLPLEELF